MKSFHFALAVLLAFVRDVAANGGGSYQREVRAPEPHSGLDVERRPPLRPIDSRSKQDRARTSRCQAR